MQADPGFFGPLQYSPGWVWCGAALLALVAGWYVYVLATTRTATRPASGSSGPDRAALTDLPALKAAYLQRIHDAEHAAAAGSLDARHAHQEISLLLRAFVRDATGVDATRMTHQDLARHPLPAAADAVQALYPAEFSPGPLPSVAASAARASAAVRAWS
ncbi:hypothetical protein QF031_001625 [Pseudarthrobacter defluvii]|uniref:hypothetical protein n=1 Tax=Pseudarthrobacter defluvii TaxID=410837 RepID=UPI00278220BF|nr:hypothetical protein [Pseudarthrobacter defluvii]MDQ0768876.1 hypothetical protein [Pseudarthrobacter defluvii]